MEELDFALDGVWASTKSIYLQKAVTISAAVPRVQTITCAGRDGDLHVSNGTMSGRTAQAVCYAVDTANSPNVSAIMSTVNAFLFGTSGYRKLKTSQDTNYYWKAIVKSGGEYAPRLNILNPFAVDFELQPYKYAVSGDTFTSSTTLINPTVFNSYPLIHVISAVANDTITIGDNVITINDTVGSFYIDCEMQDAYNGASNYNSKISCSSFPYFHPGENEIVSTAEIEIAPRWRSL